jgi:Uma2 family endonuclease
MSQPVRSITAEELAKFPADDYRYELVEGRVIRMSPVEWQHGDIVMQFGTRLGRHVDAGNLGRVVTEVGFILARNPDTVRAPDLAFVGRDRLPSRRGFFPGPPDLAVEVLSPADRQTDVRAKADEYLTHGVRLVLVLDPDEQTVGVFRRLTAPVVLGVEDELDIGDVVADFRCSVREIFS